MKLTSSTDSPCELALASVSSQVCEPDIQDSSGLLHRLETRGDTDTEPNLWQVHNKKKRVSMSEEHLHRLPLRVTFLLLLLPGRETRRGTVPAHVSAHRPGTGGSGSAGVKGPEEPPDPLQLDTDSWR